jgi:citrate lyase beta subunit
MRKPCWTTDLVLISTGVRLMLDSDLVDRLDRALAGDDDERARRYPGGTLRRQPVHTCYVPADQFSALTPRAWGDTALEAMDRHGPLPGFESCEGLEDAVRSKLAREPVEDVRIDLEDGFGVRPDAEEDAAVRSSATALRELVDAGTAPPFSGIRMKCLEGPVRRRAMRSLQLFLDTFLATGGLPEGFRVTLPKVTSVAQVEVMVSLCEALEQQHRIPLLPFEIQVETPQAILGSDGTALIAPMLHASQGRCVGLHYGTYDYSASVGVAAAFQSMEHPAADHAKAVMQLAAAGTGVPVSDGSTNILPVGDTEAVRAGWALHARLVRRSLERAFYQGWDLHPAQLPTRYAATFTFYRDGLTAACRRLRSYLDKSASEVMDEPATALALASYLVRGLDAGAVSEQEVLAGSGLGRAELDALAHRPSAGSESAER